MAIAYIRNLNLQSLRYHNTRWQHIPNTIIEKPITNTRFRTFPTACVRGATRSKVLAANCWMHKHYNVINLCMHNHDAIKILILLYLPKHLKESNGCIQNFINHYILKLNLAQRNRWFNIYHSNKSTFYWETSLIVANARGDWNM